MQVPIVVTLVANCYTPFNALTMKWWQWVKKAQFCIQLKQVFGSVSQFSGSSSKRPTLCIRTADHAASNIGHFNTFQSNATDRTFKANGTNLYGRKRHINYWTAPVSTLISHCRNDIIPRLYRRTFQPTSPSNAMSTALSAIWQLLEVTTTGGSTRSALTMIFYLQISRGALAGTNSWSQQRSTHIYATAAPRRYLPPQKHRALGLGLASRPFSSSGLQGAVVGLPCSRAVCIQWDRGEMILHACGRW